MTRARAAGCPSPRLLPSSLGLSLLVPEATGTLNIEVHWGDYHAEPLDAPDKGRDSSANPSGGQHARASEESPVACR